MKYFCNPISVNYRYQFAAGQGGRKEINREAADPSMICFKGKYYIFASMNLSVWVSEDMANWKTIRLPENLPLYDYAPDVRVIGDYVYFSASKRGEICNFYRTKDIEKGPYEEISGTFDFWDPDLFPDDDGKLYFYWGCANVTPIWGVELDPETMKPKTERIPLIYGNPFDIGYERPGEDHCKQPKTMEEVEAEWPRIVKSMGIDESRVPAQYLGFLKGMATNMPFEEGAWMTKHDGRYYLQYACPGTEYNVYGDGCYVSDFPLGPFKLAQNNPYSYHPGGYFPGAGHGSTMWDQQNNLWHTASMRISVNADMERRVGIWPAGFDAEGNLFCNQRYGDWPMAVEEGTMDPWKDPQWFPLHMGAKVTASSFTQGKGPEKAVEENVQTWWRAASADPGQWLQVDLGEAKDVRAVQVNFADDGLDLPLPAPKSQGMGARYIDGDDYTTRWKLEGSVDGENYFLLADRSEAETDLPHELIVKEDGVSIRFVKLTVYGLPYDQVPAVSGLRIFGTGSGEKPAVPAFSAVRTEARDMKVTIEGAAPADHNALGYNILWGIAEDKLYHSYMIFGQEKTVSALVKGQEYYVRVDAFNENGITEGQTVKL